MTMTTPTTKGNRDTYYAGTWYNRKYIKGVWSVIELLGMLKSGALGSGGVGTRGGLEDGKITLYVSRDVVIGTAVKHGVKLPRMCRGCWPIATYDVVQKGWTHTTEEVGLLLGVVPTVGVYASLPL